jgi:hypothetical protein
MKKTKTSQFFKATQAAMSKHSPEILTGIGIAGMITTTVLAVRATPKALMLIENEKRQQNNELLEEAKENGEKKCARIEKLKPWEVVKVAWKPYIPAAVMGVTSIACLVGSSSVSAKRNAVLATAYGLSESAFSEYRDKVTETIGEKKENAVRDKIAKEHIDKDPVQNKEVIVTAKGETLCYDLLTGRYFKSDADSIDKAVNRLNYRLMSEMYISLNEFYAELGLESNELGESLGWNIDKGQIEVYYSPQLAADGTPCLALGFYVAPRYDYRHLL